MDGYDCDFIKLAVGVDDPHCDSSSSWLLRLAWGVCGGRRNLALDACKWTGNLPDTVSNLKLLQSVHPASTSCCRGFVVCRWHLLRFTLLYCWSYRMSNRCVWALAIVTCVAVRVPPPSPARIHDRRLPL